ncbi:hypothetical protein Pse7367_1159 [Thalassoporum mexicanum PCC 7367]|uniref:hypothetical protein n=1 Tax=Thalassoporum mexicanum TaxID=3457544 RepID=UPI00029F8825|nr:hypothetical protein [Pseudanabaena sp. PCC 7367]AFY69456.1 hypothetical protein Pse7367_1159 [Pseudanabaena sp. PCC 7367]
MENAQKCPVCGVSIVNDKVFFSSGSTGTLARLQARVCQFAKQPGCINTDEDKIGEVTAVDGYLKP